MSGNSIIERTARVLDNHSGLTVFDERVVGEAQAGRFRSPANLDLAPPVQAYLKRAFPSGLYEHQHAAIEHVLRGNHTVVATRTSSGKSLIYALPVLDSLCRTPDATSLFLYPQKALAGDQVKKLADSIATIPELARRFAKRPQFVSRYDGSTPSEVRPAIRDEVQVALSNPEMLHLSLLLYHGKQWARFFRNLQYVVIDECHAYRGLFGTGMACLLRRLRAVCEHHGSNPTFVATSATVHQPQQHLEHLTGCPFQLVGPESDGSLQGPKKFWIVGGDEHFRDLGRKLSLSLVKAGLTVLAFCESRKAAEQLASKAQTEADDRSQVRVYRAGLREDDRGEIEQGLRDRTVRLVFTTSALELGIDIGTVDVVLCIGLPSSMMSLWQRAGRTARGGKEGAVILIPANSPADSHYAAHPDELYGRGAEPLVLTLGNTRVAEQHYACAIEEMGGDEEQLNLDILGEPFQKIAKLRQTGQVHASTLSQPHIEVNLRSVGGSMWTLVQRAGNIEIGEIDQYHLLTEAPLNAVYWHGGTPYRVKEILSKYRRVKLDRERGPYETESIRRKQVRLLHPDQVREYSGLTVAKAAIEVREYLSRVVEKERYTGKKIKDYPGNGGVRLFPLPTEGTVVRLKADCWGRFVQTFGVKQAESALKSLERMLASLFPTVAAICDSQDFSVHSVVAKQGEAEIYLYDLAYEGVGLTTAAFDKLDELIARALERVQNCSCNVEEGCLRCIANPNDEEETSKEATGSLLLQIQRVLRNEQPVVSHHDAQHVEPADELVCVKCEGTTPAHSQFCCHCGNKL